METSNQSPINVENESDDPIQETTEASQAECVGDGSNNHGQRKKRRLTSGVWSHFDILPAKPNEPLLCECKKCGRKYSADSKNGTGNLIRHVKNCVRMTTKDIGQYIIVSDQDASLTTRTSQFCQSKFRELVVHAIIRHDLPFSFTEYEGIRNIFKYLEPEVTSFTRNTAKSDINKIHASEFDRLRGELLACPSRISLTSDAWTSIVTDGYLSLTAHYVDSNWVLQKKILNFSYMPPPHNGVSLAEKIYSLASHWGIEKKLFAITLDNASANDVCVEILKNQLKMKNALLYDGILFHVRCCAHILNLIVQDGLKEIDIAVGKIRECVKYVKGSQARKQKFTHYVSQASLDSKKALVQDVPTRWNSTYKMLSSALYYRLAFCHLHLSDSNFQSCPTSEEWERVQKICDFLEVFYNATVAFSGSHYPTANLYFPQVFLIQLKLYEESKSTDLYMKRIAVQMFVKFNKYWCEFNVLLAIAVVFDPRYKIQFLEFSYRKLYGSGSQELVKVKETLFSLFDEYMKDSKTSPPSSSCSRVSNDVHSRKILDDNNKQSSNVFKEFDELEGCEFAGSAPRSQLDLYLEDPRSKRTTSIHVLDFWRSQEFRYPDLARLARDVLSVPVSTVASESAFSLGGRILDQYRSSMSPEVVEALICTRDWLFGEKEISQANTEEVTGRNIMASNESNLNKGEREVVLVEEANSNQL